MSTLLLAASEAGSNFVDLDIHLWEWGALLAFISTLLIVDLLLVHRKPHEIHVGRHLRAIRPEPEHHRADFAGTDAAEFVEGHRQ